TQADEAADRPADEVTRRGAELLDDRRGVVGEALHLVPARCELAAAVAAQVDVDAAVALCEALDLWIEHAPAPAHAVHEDERLRTAAGVLVIELHAIHRDMRHLPLPFQSDFVISV